MNMLDAIKVRIATRQPRAKAANLLSPSQVKHLKFGVRAVLFFGIVLSVGANVLHSLMTPTPGQPEWQLYTSLALAGLAPIVMFVMTEMVTRIPIHSLVLGWIRLIVTLAIAGLSAWISYHHLVGMAEILGETDGSQYIYPLIIDGMMVCATISLIELGRLHVAVATVVAVRETQEAAKRKCAEGCTCGRHAKKTTVGKAANRTGRTRVVTTKQAAAKAKADVPAEQVS